MKATRQFVLVAAVAALLGASLHAQPAVTPPAARQPTPDSGAGPKVKLSGTVTDGAGHPVAGATVEYWGDRESPAQPGGMEMQITTRADGAFEFQVTNNTGFLLARKPGRALAWQQLGRLFNSGDETQIELALTPPGTLAGVVMDESNQPVGGAEVSVAMAFQFMALEDGGQMLNEFSGQSARDQFSTRTDVAGHFRIENLPTNAEAILDVHAPGKDLHPAEPPSPDIESSGYRAGQMDISLVVEPAGIIEGKINGGDTQQPLPIARLILGPAGGNYVNNLLASAHKPVKSGADGAFRFEDVAAGSYFIQANFGTNALSDWVAEPVLVSVDSGQTTRDVEVMAARGALLEVSVVGENDGKPVAQVNVNAYRENSQSSAVTDRNGIAQLRLLPGDYQIAAQRPSMPLSQMSATVEAGVTNRVQIEIAAPRKISGIVRAPDGRPAAGLPVRLVGAMGPAPAGAKTDADGKFNLDWNPQVFGGQNNSTPCVLIRDVEHNLAAAQDLDENTTNLELKLAPALTFAGRVESDGKPVTNATAQLVFWTGHRGMWLSGLARNNPSGQIEIPAMPPGRKYGLVVSAPGYGQKQLFNLDVSSEPGRQELDPVELKPANLKLAGQVLDANDQPVAGCTVRVSGDDQPSVSVRTDREGRYTFDHVCEGTLQISANSQNYYGNISAVGGDTNVVLRLGQSYSSSLGAQMHQLKGVVTDADGRPVPGAQVAVFPNNGTHWSKTGTNGEYRLTWSLQPWQAQNGGAFLVVRARARDLAAAVDLAEETTNLDVKLKPALTLTGVVKNESDAPLAGAQIGLWFKAGNTYGEFDEPSKAANADGRFEIKDLPADGQYMAWASAQGYGRSQRQIENDSETNRLELEPFVLKPADRVIAGQVLDANDKPVTGVSVQIESGEQPNGQMTTDRNGRFHFQVCEGQVRLYAYSQNGGNTQATVDAGDTNIVMNLRTSSGGLPGSPPRASLMGGPLPDLAVVNLSAAAPTNQPVLLCLFDAGQRPSRHIVQSLEQQTAALRQKNVTVLGVQAAIIDDDSFNAWKSSGTVSFPVGRVTEKAAKTRWATEVSALPWFILADANHRVVAEGFSLDDLDAQIQKLPK